jgi:integrase
MGRRATGTVEPLRTSIRLKFTVLGKRCIETLELDPTPANIKAAQRLMDRIQGALRAGNYRRADFFAGSGPRATVAFADYAQEWLKTFSGAKSTKRSYKTAFSATWTPALGEMQLGDILYSDIKKAIAAKAAAASGKTVNNHLIPLRALFDMALKDGLITKDPTEGIENLAHQSPEPDPFEQDEMDLVLRHMAAKFPEPVWNYYEFAFNTGLRPSEEIALCWPDIDWRRKRARIQRAIVDWEAKGTKTNRIRDIDLPDAAIAALTRQKKHTFMKDPEGPIFCNPNTGNPWPDEQVQRRRYWNPALRSLGLRHRDAYQTRHTFATILLMGGVNVAYIAKQMGHANVTTTLTKYARWIDGADKGAEAAKLNAILSRKSPRKEAEG